MSDEEKPLLICVGAAVGELLPPHDSAIDSNKAANIMKYAEKNNAIMWKSAAPILPGGSAEQLLSHNPKEVGVMGAYGEDCVSSIVDFLVDKGIPVRVYTDYLLWRETNNNWKQLDTLTHYAELSECQVTVGLDYIQLHPHSPRNSI